MRTVVAADISRQEIERLLIKPAFDSVVLNASARRRVFEMFGRDMTAQEVVNQIVADVRTVGDKAVFDYTAALDGAVINTDNIEVSEEEFSAAFASVEPELLAALRRAVANVRRYHQEQKPKSFLTYREHGAMLGQTCLPLDRVGIYVPGGKASYPSSVIMNAVPATVAGVKEIIMAVPPAKDGSVNPLVLIAAREAGVTRVFRMGGAQAIAALAFGTATIPKVDKITGPGNLFVTLAKKAVYGYCDIDMLAGPSEILIIADASANPRYIAADMLSQAEHDELAAAILITDSATLAAAVKIKLAKQLTDLPKREIASASLEKQGLILIASNLDDAVEYANIAAPEHLEILTAEPFLLLPQIRHAGAVFLGPWSPEPVGDYYAGPNHVLPTGGTARFYSVLNVETFMKRSSIIAYTREALQAASSDIIALASAEGLDAHARAVAVRREEE
ncbi:histidinol dehydrogenase [Anaerosporomusa subterranea]|uniref:Histidinol dehydrogenase n=1 Tax=Anaerosporomusa subterranea TaxID=1794912 RepID=A0A154BNV8_ANASB|nr:histidinol dehydrogenase [Anaerosporomusa subterranea]KYZ75198.1 histidinol dehydrogenase [Anaerosporomusa subterranea]